MNRFERSVRQTLRRLFPMGDVGSYLFIAGAQKAGTSALYRYLVRHPNLTGGDVKEEGFFSRDKVFAKGAGYYRSLFPVRSRNSCVLDATPEYLYYAPCAKRIHDFSSTAKIVVLLREPVSRAFSAFNMYQQIFHQRWFKRRLRLANKDAYDFFAPIAEGRVRPELASLLEQELELVSNQSPSVEPSLIRRGIYAPQLVRYISLFGRSNVLIIFSDDLKNRPHETVNRVLSFAGPGPMTEAEYPPVHVREYTVDSKGRDLIRKCAGHLFEKDKADLAAFYGLDVPW